MLFGSSDFVKLEDLLKLNKMFNISLCIAIIDSHNQNKIAQLHEEFENFSMFKNVVVENTCKSKPAF